ncbi:hypothetical protein VCR3J2_240036 [Vibrio coralliirubri]|nr:hypothetical protein VCR3J2_240036 [Vibrio coralliirubri]
MSKRGSAAAHKADQVTMFHNILRLYLKNGSLLESQQKVSSLGKR